MKKVMLSLVVIFLVFSFIGVAPAMFIQYNSGNYQTPDGWGVIASVSPIDLSHDSYYLWSINDLSADTSLQKVNIVFHGIHDWYYGEDDWLNVYLKDSHTAPGWSVGGNDGQSTTSPDWSSYNWLGQWQDPTGGPYGSPPGGITQTYDVVFTINADDLLSLLQNGNSFTIGIDPDCHYWGDKITVEAPVPEPATVLLVGIGLIGIALFGKKRSFPHPGKNS